MFEEKARHAHLPINFDEVANVLDGRTCDGTAYRNAPSYPLSHLHRLVLNLRFMSTVALCENSDCLTTWKHRTTLIRKYVFWELATGAVGTAVALEALTDLAATCAQQPSWSERMGVAAAMARAKRSRVWTADPVPESIISRNDEFILVELIAPEHLLAESLNTGHCIGYSMACERRQKSKSKRLQNLRYWRKIELGQSRIFSLRKQGGGVFATVEYNIKWEAIVEHWFAEDTPSQVGPALSFIVKALTQFLRLRVVHYCNYRKHSGLLLRADGEWAPYEPSDQRRVLGGYLDVKATLQPEQLQTFLQHPTLTLLFYDDLIDKIEGNIGAKVILTYDRWPAGITQVSGEISASRIRSGDFSRLLDVSGALYLPHVYEGQFQNLQRVTGWVVTSISDRSRFPALHEFQGIKCYNHGKGTVDLLSVDQSPEQRS